MTKQQLIQETIKRGVKMYADVADIETSWTCGIVREAAMESGYKFNNTDYNKLSDEIYLIACEADSKIEEILAN